MIFTYSNPRSRGFCSPLSKLFCRHISFTKDCYTYSMLITTLYILSLTIVTIYTTTLFLVAYYKKDNSIIDIAYGPGFIVTAYTLVLLYLGNFSLNLPQWTLLLLITVWGTRLSYRIYGKNKGKPEDFRYKAWRDEWSEKGSLYFLIRSYLQIFLLQGLVISIVLLPFTASLPFLSTTLPLFGIMLWGIGFFFESIGDFQLDRFIKDTDPNKGTIMTSGLWKYTRHPNYFGEATMWLGIAFISFSVSSSFVVFLSPLLITYLLLYVSGIPMLEKKWEGNTQWESYKKKTSAFFPLPPKSL